MGKAKYEDGGIVVSDQYGFGELSPLPGSGAHICVSHHAEVREEYRGKGHGDRLHKERLKIMKEEGFSYSLCVVNSMNKPQLKIMEKNKWKLLETIHSGCSGHTVLLYGRKIR